MMPAYYNVHAGQILFQAVVDRNGSFMGFVEAKSTNRLKLEAEEFGFKIHGRPFCVLKKKKKKKEKVI